MKPQIRLAAARTPDGGEMVLYQHDHDFLIKVNGQELMNSRRHESECELARLGCAHLSHHKAPRILIGGLGMGYTLRQALNMLLPGATVVVSELLPAVIDWNRKFLGELNGCPLDDRRTELVNGDIFLLLKDSKSKFDAILLDVDNGPRAITDSRNQQLYNPAGIQALRSALRKQGSLAVWSAEPSKSFEQLLLDYQFHVRRYRANAYPGSNSKPLFIWVAAQDENLLPPGGSQPYNPGRRRIREATKPVK